MSDSLKVQSTVRPAKLSIWLQNKLGKMFDNRTFANNFTNFSGYHWLYKGINIIFMEKNEKLIPEDQVLTEEMKSFAEMNINSDADIPGNTHLSNGESENLTDKLQAELDEQKDKYIRLLAEFDNFKRRNAKERIELIQTAGKEVIVSLLDVLDDSDRAEKQLQTSNDLEQIKEGVQLVFGKLRNILQAKGLKPMESLHTEF
ncbi:MAG: nucleotide exchange factor GrpE, partial [Ferruginibacter sp.]